MAAKTIVTSHPDVACDVCGRRLLRGEQPDVFLGGGQRRIVCELCTPRATHEGWRRETDRPESPQHSAGLLGRRSQRGRSLLGRLGWPLADRARQSPPDRAARSAARRAAAAERAGPEDSGRSEQPYSDGATPLDEEWAGIGEDWAQTSGEWSASAETPESVETPHDATPAGSDWAGTGHASADVARALEVFNIGEHPRRIAGVARSLGPACVKAAPLADAERTVAIVVAWELCWYRYEIDLHDELAGARLTADGMELDELPAEDRVANAAADERGELSLL